MVLTLSHTQRSDDSFDDFWRRGAVPSRRGGAGSSASAAIGAPHSPPALGCRHLMMGSRGREEPCLENICTLQLRGAKFMFLGSLLECGLCCISFVPCIWLL